MFNLPPFWNILSPTLSPSGASQCGGLHSLLIGSAPAIFEPAVNDGRVTAKVSVDLVV